MRSGGGTVVLFPFMAQGHINPFLDLARRLSSHLPPPLTITIISTQANIINLRPRFHSYPTIHFAEIAFENPVQNTDSLSSLAAIARFYRTAESHLQLPFRHLIGEITRSSGGKPPLCIISDMFLGFTVDVAHEFGSKHVPFYTSGPYAMSIYNCIWTHFPHLQLKTANAGNEGEEDDIIPLPGLLHVTIRRSQLSNNMKAADPVNDPTSLNTKRQAEYCSRADGSLWNTLEVLEKTSLDEWGRKTGKPVWAIGPLLPSSKQGYERGGKQPTLSPQICIDWLNLQSDNSVLYVSFGSQNSIPCAQMIQLAKWLEQSGKAFIWVLRNPTGIDVNEEFKPEWLPEGFEDRMRETGMGLIVRNWAPQIEILEHRSVGAFLSHCGWNSVLESLSRGVPIIGWPLGSEQYYNVKLLEEELGVCMEVARGYDAKIDSGEMADKVKMALGGKKGMEMKRKAEALSAEMKKAVEADADTKGTSLRALEDFVETLLRWDDENNEGSSNSDMVTEV
nr:glycosyltransferase [Helleborus thibetanus]